MWCDREKIRIFGLVQLGDRTAVNSGSRTITGCCLMRPDRLYPPDNFELMTPLCLEQLEQDLRGVVRERLKRDVLVEERLEDLVEHFFDAYGREVVGDVSCTYDRFHHVRKGLRAVCD